MYPQVALNKYAMVKENLLMKSYSGHNNPYIRMYVLCTKCFSNWWRFNE